MKRKDLEIALQKVLPFPVPRPDLEQYLTPATIAADLLFSAYSQGDIEGKDVVDLGSGTGMLAIGAAMLGARQVIGVDVDEGAVALARENAERAGVEVNFVNCDVNEVGGICDTVVMNPPFGAQRRHADRPFLEKAISVASVAYSLHLAGTEEFVLRLIHSAGATGEIQKRYKFEIPHTFAFHRQAKRDVEVILVRIQKGESR